MRVTTDDVRHIASLARLRFSEVEQERLADELSRILDYVDQLDELDTSAVPPMAHPASGAANVFRPDRAEQRVSREEALANAPDTDGTYFRVPKVIE